MSNKPTKPEQYLLDKVLANYVVDPEEGLVYNLEGKVVSRSNGKNGRIVLSFWDSERKRTCNLQVSHLVWWVFTGEWPSEMLDHEDRDKSNNRINNLRYTDKRLNAINSHYGDRILPTNVSLYPRYEARPYQVQITIKGRAYHLGFYSSVEEAVAARDSKIREFANEQIAA